MPRKTIYDIAKEAGVSIATVSRVMNQSPEISEGTRERVLRIADEMGYYPQAYAQGLARQKKNRIMILVPLISNYFFMEVLAGIQNEISGNDFELTIFNVSGNGETMYSQVETIIKKHVADGYILISIHLKDEQLKNLLKYDVPLSLVDEKYGKMDSVITNNHEGIHKAMNYFINKGYSRIAFLSASKSSKPSLKRIKGYKKSLKNAGLKIDDSLIVTGNTMERDGFTEKNGYQAMKKLLNMTPLPEACFCASDIQAIGALKAMREMEINIPIIGYDDITISDYIGLSTVRQPMYKMGKQATKKLINRMDDHTREPVQTTFQPELILRRSTEVY
ncbi:MAG TPA: LacI family DNA-binding transcriptional regulator [Balneolaceae bacterium]|nr:LacI family DNA-binding transcriptional regulator [Balneolaceae bacterium]